MTTYSQRKGSQAERELAELLTFLTGHHCRRALGAGRHDDIGDLVGLPDTVCQSASWADLDRCVTTKLPQVAVQKKNAAARFAALFCRRRGGQWIVVMTIEEWTELWLAATSRH